MCLKRKRRDYYTRHIVYLVCVSECMYLLYPYIVPNDDDDDDDIETSAPRIIVSNVSELLSLENLQHLYR